MAFTNQTVAINKILEYFYQVPDYQRGYVWDQERVSDFLGSIIEHNNNKESNKYFIGAAVFEASHETNKYFVVDGQQRLSTIFIVICAAYNLLKKLKAPEKTLSSIADDFLFKYNRKEKNSELKIQHADKDCVKALYDILEDKDETPENVSQSAENIYVAYREAKKILRKEYLVEEAAQPDATEDEKVEATRLLEGFIDHFEHVTALPFISQSRDESLTVFETLNSKGVGLSNLDILKSLLFDAIKEDEDEWDSLTKKWNDFYSLFEPLKIQPNKFLRYTVVTQFGESMAAAKCLQWIKDNDSITKIKSNPGLLISKMSTVAEAIKEIRLGNAKHKKQNMHLMNIRRLAPSAEQQYFMLIPVWDADESVFNAACRVAESVIFVNKILAHYTGSTEKNFIEWGKALAAKKKNLSEVNDYIENVIQPVLADEKPKLEAVLIKSTWKNTNRGLIAWILKRCEVFAAQICKDDIAKGVDLYQNTDIEHIEPQSSTELDDSYIHALGNLTIQEKGFNRANGKLKFDQKLSSYGKSAFKMTNALHGMPQTGGVTKKAYELFYTAEKWGATEIHDRTSKLVSTILEALDFKDRKLI